ncbi:MAG: EI24 domain-containing protein [Saprospiraceae bacterium]
MGAFKAFFRGFTAYFKVISLFSKLGLWRYLLLTAAISLGVMIVIGFIAYAMANVVLAIDWTSVFGGYKAFEIAAAVVAFVSVLAIGLLLFKHLVLIATAPWMGKVAERVSDHVTSLQGVEPGLPHGKTKAERWTLIKRSIRLNGRLFSFEMMLTIPLLILGLIPGVNIGAAVALIVVQSYFVGAGALDFTLEERYSYGESVAYFNQNRWLTIGLGLGFVLLLFTAIGFLFAPAWSAAASAYAFHQRTGDQRQ